MNREIEGFHTVRWRSNGVNGNLVFTDETFHLFVVASVAATSRFGRLKCRRIVVGGGRPTRIEDFAESILSSVGLSLSLFCPSFFRSSTIRYAATPAIWLRTFVVFGFWVPGATAVQVLRSFCPDLSLNAERRYQRFGISSSSFRREGLLCVIEFYSGTDHLSCSFFRRYVLFSSFSFCSSGVPCRWWKIIPVVCSFLRVMFR